MGYTWNGGDEKIESVLRDELPEAAATGCTIGLVLLGAAITVGCLFMWWLLASA